MNTSIITVELIAFQTMFQVEKFNVLVFSITNDTECNPDVYADAYLLC